MKSRSLVLSRHTKAMARLAERPSRTRTLAAPQSPAAAGRRHRRSAGRAIIPDGSTRVWPGSWGRTAYHGHEPVPLLELTAHDAQIGDVNGADLAVHRHAGCDRMTIVHVFSAYSYWPNGESGPLLVWNDCACATSCKSLDEHTITLCVSKPVRSHCRVPVRTFQCVQTFS